MSGQQWSTVVSVATAQLVAGIGLRRSLRQRPQGTLAALALLPVDWLDGLVRDVAGIGPGLCAIRTRDRKRRQIPSPVRKGHLAFA